MRVRELSDAELRAAFFETMRDLRVLVTNFDSFNGATRVFVLGTSAGLASYAQSLEEEAQKRKTQEMHRDTRTRAVSS